MDFYMIFLAILIISFFIPVMQKSILSVRRFNFISKLEKERNSRVIVMIHRQEAVSFLGIPVFRYISIEDSEQILKAIRLTSPEMPIDLILHTPGGITLASEQIAFALKKHPAKVTMYITHYAMSGGTMIALAADEIVMDENAVLGPVDPQIGNYPAASLVRVLDLKEPQDISDKILILADIARKALYQVETKVHHLLEDKVGEEKARDLAKILTEGRWTHDHPITFEDATRLGLPVKKEMPVNIYKLMDLYPQPSSKPSVQYIPLPYRGKNGNR
ncbi:MAG: hypothetical protein DDT22_00208 [candidate division WS2 bacterium]|nr:hypothetical protein [Candidatus Lithacetigena glycinireducens]MBT9174548.1 hypothetical protein [Candidatus Lithacetigena glycinireducens]